MFFFLSVEYFQPLLTLVFSSLQCNIKRDKKKKCTWAIWERNLIIWQRKEMQAETICLLIFRIKGMVSRAIWKVQLRGEKCFSALKLIDFFWEIIKTLDVREVWRFQKYLGESRLCLSPAVWFSPVHDPFPGKLVCIVAERRQLGKNTTHEAMESSHRTQNGVCSLSS